MKKMMLLALAVASVAMFALPAVASATPWHLNAGGAFTIHGNGPTSLSTTTGETITCNGTVTGSGNYTTTTSGTMQLTFGGTCSTVVFGFPVHCNSAGESNNSITTAVLPFDNVMLAANNPGILVTPNAGSFATFSCFGVGVTVTGNGVLGRVEKKCGESSVTASVDFNATAHGKQEFTTYTGVNYHLKKGEATSAQDTTGTVTFTNGVARTINCT